MWVKIIECKKHTWCILHQRKRLNPWSLLYANNTTQIVKLNFTCTHKVISRWIININNFINLNKRIHYLQRSIKPALSLLQGTLLHLTVKIKYTILESWFTSDTPDSLVIYSSWFTADWYPYCTLGVPDPRKQRGGRATLAFK